MKNLLTTLLLLVGVSAFGQGTAIRSQNGFGTNTSFYGTVTNATINQMGSSVLGSLWTLLDTNGLNRIAIVSTNMTFRDTNNIQLRISPNGVEAVTAGFVGNGAGLTNLDISTASGNIWTNDGMDLISIVDEEGSPNQLTYFLDDQTLTVRRIKTLAASNPEGEITLGHESGGMWVMDGNGNPYQIVNMESINELTIGGVIRILTDTGDIEFGPQLWHIDPITFDFLPGAIGDSEDNVASIGAATNRIATVYAASVISDNFTGNGAGLTNLVGATNFSSTVTYNFNGKVTFNAVSYNTNAWAGPTNPIVLTTNYQFFVASTDCEITGVSGQLSDQNTWSTLTVSNSTASPITVRSTATGFRLQGAASTAALVIGAGKEGYLSFHSRGTLSTNLVTSTQSN